MPVKRLVLFFLIAVLSTPWWGSLWAAPTELLANGGFENGISGWHTFGGQLAQVARPVYSGNFAVAYTSADFRAKWFYQDVPVTTGALYAFSGWAIKNSPDIAEVQLRISWHSQSTGYGSGQAAGSELSSVTSEGLTSDSAAYRFLSTSQVAAPYSAIIARLKVILVLASGNKATAYFDGLSFMGYGSSSPTPATTPLPGTAGDIAQGGSTSGSAEPPAVPFLPSPSPAPAVLPSPTPLLSPTPAVKATPTPRPTPTKTPTLRPTPTPAVKPTPQPRPIATLRPTPAQGAGALVPTPVPSPPLLQPSPASPLTTPVPQPQIPPVERPPESGAEAPGFGSPLQAEETERPPLALPRTAPGSLDAPSPQASPAPGSLASATAPHPPIISQGAATPETSPPSTLSSGQGEPTGPLEDSPFPAPMSDPGSSPAHLAIALALLGAASAALSLWLKKWGQR